jgi:hypothetical protein
MASSRNKNPALQPIPQLNQQRAELPQDRLEPVNRDRKGRNGQRRKRPRLRTPKNKNLVVKTL